MIESALQVKDLVLGTTTEICDVVNFDRRCQKVPLITIRPWPLGEAAGRSGSEVGVPSNVSHSAGMIVFDRVNEPRCAGYE